MGIEKLWKHSRADRLKDPDVQRDIDQEWKKVKESFGRLGKQTKVTCSETLYNSLVRPFVRIKHGKKLEFNPGKQFVDGAVDSVAEGVVLAWRILAASGRTAKYGVRRAMAI